VAAGKGDQIVTRKLEGDEGREINVARATYAALQLLRGLLTGDEVKEAE
jgi:nicotinamide-nucleotide amidase